MAALAAQGEALVLVIRKPLLVNHVLCKRTLSDANDVCKRSLYCSIRFRDALKPGSAGGRLRGWGACCHAGAPIVISGDLISAAAMMMQCMWRGHGGVCMSEGTQGSTPMQTHILVD